MMVSALSTEENERAPGVARFLFKEAAASALSAKLALARKVLNGTFRP